MFCSQIAPWHGPNPKQIEPWTVWEKWIIHCLTSISFCYTSFSWRIMKYWSNRIYVKKNSIFSAFLRDYWHHWSLLFESREAWNMIHQIMFVIFLWRNWMFWFDIMWHIDVSQTAQICGFNDEWKGKNNRAL